jgi:hypothetical protein
LATGSAKKVRLHACEQAASGLLTWHPFRCPQAAKITAKRQHFVQKARHTNPHSTLVF